MIRLALLPLLILAACGTPASSAGDASVVDTVLLDAPRADATGPDAPGDGSASPDVIVPDVADGQVADASTPRASATSLLSCTRDADCDDGIPCTTQVCTPRPDGSRRCTYIPEPTLCGAGETCDLRMGCQRGRTCATNTDCADMDPCTLRERCSTDARLCVYDALLDGDDDGFAPRSCGGGDCNDSTAAVHPGVSERCNGTDDNCDGRTDEGSARDLCGEGASCTSSHCALDTPVAYADLARLCALQFACVGSLAEGFGSMRTVNNCIDYLASQWPDVTVGVEIAEMNSGSGTVRVINEMGVDPTFLREALARARTARTCAEYLGMRGGPPTCEVATRDYVRCEGTMVRFGCAPPIACRPGTRCSVTSSEMMRGETRIYRASATCTPTATSVPVRCADGTTTDSRMPRCPMESTLRCTAETACEGDRLSLCQNLQRFDLDCAALIAGGACMSGRCVAR